MILCVSPISICWTLITSPLFILLVGVWKDSVDDYHRHLQAQLVTEFVR